MQGTQESQDAELWESAIKNLKASPVSFSAQMGFASSACWTLLFVWFMEICIKIWFLLWIVQSNGAAVVKKKRKLWGIHWAHKPRSDPQLERDENAQHVW